MREVLPAGYLNRPSAVTPGDCGGVGCTAGTASTTGTTDLIEGIQLTGNGTGYNFGEQAGAEISGKVFLDYGNDGVENGSDAGIGGQIIELRDATDAVVATTTTAPDGTFAFTLLPPGTYTVHQPNQPAGTANGITTPGTVSGVSTGTATPVTTLPSQIATITLAAGEKSIDNLFAEIPTRSTIAGHIWADDNDNGVMDTGEAGFPGETVVLTGVDINGNAVNRSTVTGANGSYVFTDLPAGTYTVTQPNQPAGTLSGHTVPGNIGGVPLAGATATPKTTVPSEIGSIVLGENQHAVENNFGEIPMDGSITGRVWLDQNNNGVVDGSETGIAGVRVRLTGTDAYGNAVSLETVTDAMGFYTFAGLAAGTYTITEPEQPAGTMNGQTVPGSHGGTGTSPATPVSVIATVVLGVNEHSVENNFGEIVSNTSLSGTVYYDNNDNGVQEPGEPGIPNVEIVLTGTDDNGDPVHRTTTTDSEGHYRFEGLRPGTYTVTQPTQPAGTLNGETTPGSTGGTATPKTTPTSVISSIVLMAGVESVVNNFGEISNTPDMLVTKSVNPAVLIHNNEATYTLTVRNGGKSITVGEYIVEDRLPVGVTLLATPTGDGWMCSGAAGDTRFACRSSTVLAAGQVSAATITARVTVSTEAVDAGTVNNAVLVSGGGEHPSQGPTPEERDAFEGDVTTLPVCEPAVVHNACRLPSEVVLAWPDMVVSKAANSDVFTIGGRYEYTIQVRNRGERASEGEYIVRDRLPHGIVLAAAPTGDGWTCTGAVGGSNFQCASTRVLAAGEVHPNAIRVPVSVNPEAESAEPVNNVVIVNGGGENPDRAPTPDDEDAFTNRPADLEVCDPAITQNLCRVPTEVQSSRDPAAIAISKRGDRTMAEIGDIVLYTIDIRHVSGNGMSRVDVLDRLPRGFTYIEGTARVDGLSVTTPQGAPGPNLIFDVGALPPGTQKVLTYRVRIGVGAQQSDGINRAQAQGCWTLTGCIDPDSLTPRPDATASNQAEFRVRVTGGVFTSEACVLGKVFVDCNNNHVQDHEELGIPGVRLYFSDGTWMISDSEGKYSYCGLPPQSHTLKVDPSTLPQGSRLTTSSNRNLGDADSLFLDLKNGELHRADFIEGSCSNPVLEQVKARRSIGEVRAPETETEQTKLRFESKPLRAPQQATDSANQVPLIKTRASATQEVQP